ncbi:hypothetical protein AVEN_161367-1 [Araneus ventricosus]|uniref:Uncharacterized protein n=1 Tax=Araneus ventricosus TaxID=182803 RepID=A0A4Y2VKN6_ARAVE|nr:hypothetical protein AVEN_161367-1 [Araneus ventricosus]
MRRCPVERFDFQLGRQTPCKGATLRDDVQKVRSFHGVVENVAWSTKAHEWDVFSTVPYPIVSAELCVPKHLRLDLHCIGQSAEPLSDSDIALPSGTVSDVLFL